MHAVAEAKLPQQQQQQQQHKKKMKNALSWEFYNHALKTEFVAAVGMLQTK